MSAETLALYCTSLYLSTRPRPDSYIGGGRGRVQGRGWR